MSRDRRRASTKGGHVIRASCRATWRHATIETVIFFLSLFLSFLVFFFPFSFFLSFFFFVSFCLFPPCVFCTLFSFLISFLGVHARLFLFFCFCFFYLFIFFSILLILVSVDILFFNWFAEILTRVSRDKNWSTPRPLPPMIDSKVFDASANFFSSSFFFNYFTFPFLSFFSNVRWLVK